MIPLRNSNPDCGSDSFHDDGLSMVRPTQDAQCGHCGCRLGLAPSDCLRFSFAATSGGYLPRRILVAVLVASWACPPLLLHTEPTAFWDILRRTLCFAAGKSGALPPSEAFLLLSESGLVCGFLSHSRRWLWRISLASLDRMGSGRHP